ncbi:N-methyl-L-tryptophan oxidase [Ancylobacter oerskovii]|uniref:N-methyl-L-tryptophan oxidase n=1 Tax=Ancylobacter oerskovii TaxID=459519 RepID=A0ABW4Z0Y2_9HYPH|nr:N-methyl-L-tryptophan oxidase [Ancylobacter oerskovii]MBS7542759.1 N-methyl-L-tryptophan oxidase [Ancylobacter oerskovii]
MTASDYDVAVIGLGAMGSAALAHLAARGLRVVGIEAFSPAHGLSSSHGDSRIIRLGYFEDPSYVPLLRRAYENWRRLEAETGADILTITGVLQIGRPDSPIVAGTLASCRAYGLDHEILDAEAMARRHPAFALDPDEIAVFETQGGFVRPETAVTAHLALARREGAELRMAARVTAIEPDDAGVTLRLGAEPLRARRVVVATGPWIAELVPALAALATPIRQVVAWYEPKDAAATALGTMPVFLRDAGPVGSFFGFPALDGAGVKIGKHAHFREPIGDPDAPNAAVNEADTALLDDFISRRLPLAAGERRASTTCRYTMLPGEDFLLDRLPGEPNVVVASPCSGHGYKFASVVGEILADLAQDGETRWPVEAFSFRALRDKAAAVPAL